MRDVLEELVRRVEAGETVGLGTVVSTWNSAPRPAGAAMFVDAVGSVSGSVSGGCVEGAVYELAQQVVADGTPVLQRYGVSGDDAFAVGLTCGGIIDVYVEPVSAESFPELPDVLEAVRSRQPVAVATVVEHPGWLGRRLVVWPNRVSDDRGLPARPRRDHRRRQGNARRRS